VRSPGHLSNAAKPEELERQALAAYRAGNLPAAADGFEAARAAYLTAGDSLKAAEMANNRCVTLVGLDRGQEAVQAVEGTSAVFAAAGDRRRAARALGNLAAALESAGQLERAAATYEAALEGLRAAGDRAGESDTWQALSRLQLRRGDTLGAAASAQSALDTHPRPGVIRRLVRTLTRGAFRLPRW
jgi:tetratricopeptide (TPR) repeat protein